jgi:hypothetical protein
MPDHLHALANHVLDVDRRKAGRHSVAFETLMSDREGNVFGAGVLNLSLTGLMATTDVPLCQRDPVRIDLPTIGWVRADIVWVLGDKIGARFRQPIRQYELDLFQSRFA